MPQDYVPGYSQSVLSKLTFWSVIDRELERKVWVTVRSLVVQHSGNQPGFVGPRSIQRIQQVAPSRSLFVP
jgi:hypothetical protein